MSRTTGSNPPKSKFLENKNYSVIDGIKYINVADHIDMKEAPSRLCDFNFREDDVLLASFPKSGTHWMFEVLTMILQQSTEFNKTKMIQCLVEEAVFDPKQELDTFESPRLLVSHLRMHRLPEQIVEKRVKIVCVLRNPKDVAVSMYNMFNSFIPKNLKYEEPFAEFLSQFLTGEFFWGDWFGHTWSIEHFMKSHPDHPVYIVSYERMKTSPEVVIKELCAFLNKPDAIATGIAQATEMSNMKKVLMSGKELDSHKDLFSDQGGMFRKGIVGDWKQWLTVRQNEVTNQLFEEKMSGSKLACLVKDYI